VTVEQWWNGDKQIKLKEPGQKPAALSPCVHISHGHPGLKRGLAVKSQILTS
jgi:hypothetical protein